MGLYFPASNTRRGSVIGAVEARRDDGGEKDRLCPRVAFPGFGLIDLARQRMTAIMARGADPDGCLERRIYPCLRRFLGEGERRRQSRSSAPHAVTTTMRLSASAVSVASRCR